MNEVITLTLVPLSLGVHQASAGATPIRTPSESEVDVALHVAEPLLGAAAQLSGAAAPITSWSQLGGGGGAGNAADSSFLQDVTNRKKKDKKSSQSKDVVVAATPVPLSTPAPMTSSAAAAGGSDPDLLRRLHYAVASYSTELELKRVLSNCLDARQHHVFATNGSSSTVAQRLRPSARSCMVSTDGSRSVYVFPVEDGRYLLTVSVPPSLWERLGPSVVPLLLRSAVTGYVVPPAVAACTSKPAYVPLHARLGESPAAVQEAMRSAVQQLVSWYRQVHANLPPSVENRGKAAAKPAGSPSAVDKLELYIALVRLCRERFSLLRVADTVLHLLDKFVQEATAADDPSSLRGPIGAQGMAEGQCRYVCGAAALWYRGHPVYSSLASAPSEAANYVHEQQLLPAAASTMLEAAARNPQYLARACAGNAIVQRCTAMGAAPSRRVTIGGYQQRTRPRGEDGTATLVVSAASARGWTVAVALTRSAVPFVGTPLPILTANLEHLLQQRLESSELFALLFTNTIANYIARPTGLLSSVSARLLGCVAHLRVLQRRAGQVGRDVCLFVLPPATVSAPTSKGGGLFRRKRVEGTTPEEDNQRAEIALGLTAGVAWQRPYDRRIEQLLSACARLGSSKYRLVTCQYGAPERSSGGARAASPTTKALAPEHTVTSVLKGADQQLVLFHGVCPLNRRGIVHYVVAEIDTSALSRKEHKIPLVAMPQECISLTTWLLSRTL